MHRQKDRILKFVCAAVLGAAGGKALAQDAGTADTTNYIMTDFEGSPLGTPLGGFWFFYTDMNTATVIDTVFGNSRITSLDSSLQPLYDSAYNYDVKTFPAGRTGEPGSRALRFAFELGDRPLSCGEACTYEPYVGFGMAFSWMPDTVDLTGATAISFWAKSEGDTVVTNVSLTLKDTISGSADYAQIFKISGPEWKQYTMKLEPSEDLKQPDWAVAKPFNLAHAAGLGFNVNRGQNPVDTAGAIQIDDIVIENWQYHYPDNDAIRSRPRTAAGRGGWRLQIQGSQVRFIRTEGNRTVPVNLNGRALPLR